MAAENGNTLLVHYTGTLDDGTVFDSSRDREPLEFVLGSGMLIPGFDKAVLGKEVGDIVKTNIPSAEAYGERIDELVGIVPRSDIPDSITPEVGMMLQVSTDQGPLDVVISRVDDDEVELDGNHPLAGKDLIFEIEIVEIKA